MAEDLECPKGFNYDNLLRIFGEIPSRRIYEIAEGKYPTPIEGAFLLWLQNNKEVGASLLKKHVDPNQRTFSNNIYDLLKVINKDIYQESPFAFWVDEHYKDQFIGYNYKNKLVEEIKDKIIGNATSYIVHENEVLIPYGKSEKIKTQEQSFKVANRIIDKINNEYGEKTVSLNNSYKDGVGINIHPKTYPAEYNYEGRINYPKTSDSKSDEELSEEIRQQNNDIEFKKDLKIKQDSQWSDETLINLAENLKKRVGNDYSFVTQQEAIDILKDTKSPYTNQKAFYYQGKVYLIKGMVSPTDLCHEWCHPVLNSLYKENPTLFNKLYTDLQKSTEGQDIIIRVNETYVDENGVSDFAPDEETRFRAECLAHGLEKDVNSKIQNEEPSKGFKDFIKNLWFGIKQLLRKIFGKDSAEKRVNINLDKLDSNTNLKEFADMIGKDYFNLYKDPNDRNVYPSKDLEPPEDLSGEVYDDSNIPIDYGDYIQGEPDLPIDKKLDAEVKRQQNSLENLRKELSKEVTPQAQNKLKLRIATINSTLRNLNENQTWENIVNITQKSINYANKIGLKEDLSGKDLVFIKGTLDRIDTVADTIRVGLENKKEELDSLEPKLGDIQKQISFLKNSYSIWATQYLTDISNEQGLGYKFEDILKPVEDIGTSKKLFLSTSTTHSIPLMNIGDHLFNEVKNRMTDEMIEFNTKLEELKKTTTKDDIKALLDKDNKLILPYTSDYFTRERDIIDEASRKYSVAKSNAERRSTARKVAEWYKDNNKYKHTPESRESYERELRNHVEAVSDDNGDVTDPTDIQTIQAWINQNSPDIGLNFALPEGTTYQANSSLETAEGVIEYFKNKLEPKYENKIANGAFNIANKQWYKYLHSEPIDKYINPDYDTVKNNDLYKFIIEHMEKGMEKVPTSLQQTLNGFNHIFNQLIFDIDKKSLPTAKKVWSGTKDTIKNWFTDVLNYEEISGESHDIINEKGETKPVLRAPDITKIKERENVNNPLELVDKFYRLATAYELKSDVEPILQTISGLLETQESIKLTKAGVPIEVGGVIQTIKGGLINATEMFKYNVLAEVFGGKYKRLDQPSYTLTSKEKSDFEKEHGAWVEGRNKALKEGNNIWLQENPEPVIRKVSGLKTVESVVDFTRGVLIYGKPISALNHLFIGMLNNSQHASRREDFDDKQLGEATKILTNSILKYITFGKVVTTQAQKILGVVHAVGFSDRTSENTQEYVSRILKNIQRYGLAWEQSGEFFTRGQIVIAKMRKATIQDLSGNTTSVYDSFDNKGIFKESEYGPINEAFKTCSQQKSWDEFRNRTKEVRDKSRGNVDSSILFKGHWWGQMLMMFRNWIPQGIYTRFGAESGDFKGRYRTYQDSWVAFSEAGSRWNLVKGGVISLLTKLANIPGLSQLGVHSLSTLCEERFEQQLKDKGLSDTDISNFRANIRELQTIVYLSGIMFGLAFLLSKDKKNKEIIAAINLGNRIHQELTFFFNFSSAVSVIRDPIPLTNTIKDAYQFVNAAENYCLQPEKRVYRSGIFRGESKLGVATEKLFPITSALESLNSITSQVYPTSPY